MLIKYAYPNIWDSVFDILIEYSQSDVFHLKLLFCVFEQLNDEVIDREAYTTNEDVVYANKVKDGMRKGDLSKIVYLCKQVLDSYTQFEKEIGIGAIDTIADLIEWGDLALFEPLLEIITKLLDEKNYHQEALY